jgi:glycosyltransferase involved in cell wall biosynthesis
MLPFAAEPLRRSPRPRCHLDLDDLESSTSLRLAALHRLAGDELLAELEASNVGGLAAAEAAALDACDRIYVCSEQDRRRLAGRGSAEVHVLPNAVEDPGPLPPPGEAGPFRFLFVGTLSYFPNEEGLSFFIREVLPRLRRAAPRDFILQIVGTGASAELARLAKAPNVELVGPVLEVGPWYQQAQAVIVPLRAGGGTRIKAIEAFSYQRPVVGTTIGLEGLAVQPDEHALVGDSADELAAQCLRLMADPQLAERLAARAYALFKLAYSSEALAGIVASFA